MSKGKLIWGGIIGAGLLAAVILLSNVQLWWTVINSQIPKLLGSKLECQQVSWCGPLKICAHQCITIEKTQKAEELSFSLITGKSVANNWTFLKAPDRLKNRTYFPRITKLIREIKLYHGDLTAIFPSFNDFDYIHLKRASLMGQQWNLQAHFHNDQLRAAGLVGDKTDLKITLHDLPATFDQLPDLLFSEGNITLRNSSFKQAPVYTSIDNIKIATTTENEFSLQKIDLKKALIKLDKDFKFQQVQSLQGLLSNSSGEIQVSKTSEEKNIEVTANNADVLLPYINHIDKNIQWLKLRGQAHTTIASDLNLSDIEIFLENMQPSFIYKGSRVETKGALSVKLSNLSDPQANIQFKDLQILSPEAFKPPEITQEIEGGIFNGELDYKHGLNDLSGKFTIKDISVTDHTLDLTAYSREGHFTMQEGTLKAKMPVELDGIIKGQVNLQADIKLDKVLSGKIQADSDRLALNKFSNRSLEISGQIHSLKSLLALEGQKIQAKDLSLLIKDLTVVDSGKSQTLTTDLSGKVKIHNNSLMADIKEPNGTQLHLSSTDIHGHSLQAQGKISLSRAVKLYGLEDEIKNASGFAELKGQIQGNKLKKLAIDLHDLGFEFDKLDISALNGHVYNSTETGKLKLKDVSLAQGKGSKLTFNGIFEMPADLKSFRRGNQQLRSFEGHLQGEILSTDLKSLLSKKLADYIPDGHLFPLELEVKPEKKHHLHFRLVSGQEPYYIRGDGSLDLQSKFFVFRDLLCNFQGIKLSAEAKGFLHNFSFSSFTDPEIDLRGVAKLLGKDKSFNGHLNGFAKGTNLDISDRKSFWNNLQVNLFTNASEEINLGNLSLKGLNLQYLSRQGKGFSTITAKTSKLSNLELNDLNASLKLKDNKLTINGFNLKAAGGDINLNGQYNIINQNSYLSATVNNLQVGTLAWGLAGLRGFSGIGDFSFKLNGHLPSLLSGKNSVSADGSFFLHDGHISKVTSLQKKLNLANLVFGGPYSLSINSFLNVLMPEDNGYYDELFGEVHLHDNQLVAPLIQYRGKSGLNLNTAALWDRNNDLLRANIIGSIPKITRRVNSQGKSSDALNALSTLSIAGILSQLKIFKNHRTFSFSIEGSPDDAKGMDAYANRTFQWIEKGNASLPTPKVPEAKRR